MDFFHAQSLLNLRAWGVVLLSVSFLFWHLGETHTVNFFYPEVLFYLRAWGVVLLQGSFLFIGIFFVGIVRRPQAIKPGYQGVSVALTSPLVAAAWWTKRTK